MQLEHLRVVRRDDDDIFEGDWIFGAGATDPGGAGIQNLRPERVHPVSFLDRVGDWTW
jgi:hypothetical protein